MDEFDMYKGDDNSDPDGLLKDMSSVMKRKKEPLKEEVESINNRMMKHATAIDNLVRENRTLRHKNTSLINDNRTLNNFVNSMSKDIELLKRALIEQSQRIDELEKNVIIRSNRR